MLTMLRALVATALLGGASLATAGDFCLHDNFTNTFVGKSFSLPSKGACKDFHGFFQDATDIALFGEACGSSDNTRITFRLTIVGLNEIGAYLFTLDREALSGSGQICTAAVTGSGACNQVTSIAKTACSPSTVPVD